MFQKVKYCINFKKIRSFLRLGVFLCLLWPVASVIYAQSLDSKQLIEYLQQEKNQLTLKIATTVLPVTEDATANQQNLEESKAKIAFNTAKIATLENFLVSQKKLQLDFSQQLKQLEQVSIAHAPLTTLQEKIEALNADRALNKQTIDLINDNLLLANKFQDKLLQEQKKLELYYAKLQMQQRNDNLKEHEQQLKQSLQTLIGKNLTLESGQASPTDTNSFINEAKILLNNQLINLTQYKISELALQRKLTQADYLLQQSPDIRTLQTVTEIYQSVTDELREMEQALRVVLATLREALPHIKDQSLKQQFQSLIRIVNGRISGIVIHEQTLEEDLENHNKALKKQLSVRQSLSEYKLTAWPEIFLQLKAIPAQFYTYLKSLTLKVRDNYLWQDHVHPFFLGVGFTAFLTTFYVLRRLLNRLTKDKERFRLASHLYHGMLILLNRNLPQIAIATFFLLVFSYTKIPFSNYLLLVNLLVVWMAYRTFLLIARLGLLERISDNSGIDVTLYHRIKWLLMLGVATVMLLLLSYQLPVALIIQDICNRLFMFFLLIISLVALQSRSVISTLFHPFLQNKRKYLRHAVMLMLVLVPLTLFVIASIGLVGYINLAWTLNRYQIQILLIISCYILLRGLLFDALELISEWMIKKQKNGWLWVEVILKPFDKLLRISLVISCLYVIFILFGKTAKSTLLATLAHFGQYPLINMSGIYVTTFSIIEFLFALSVLVWTSKWSREFSYRWLYRQAKDTGIRNSLSVFTQYAVVLFGGVLALRILGFDFSGLSLLIGGLAVGMGFGLRDFASNIVGGIMLLIERPVREGDLVTIGNYEGRVAHIGIRSMRVSSWDNMEVLIPNAETFNKPFTNWTHQDSVIRTVIPIKVRREDDPILVQELILDVLAVVPEILPDPAPQVLLMKIDEALIEFEARYFINVSSHTRFEIRSKVLFALTNQFKKAGIRSPITSLAVELKEPIHADAE